MYRLGLSRRTAVWYSVWCFNIGRHKLQNTSDRPGSSDSSEEHRKCGSLRAVSAMLLSTNYRRDARVQVLRDAWLTAARDQIIDTANSRHRYSADERAAAHATSWTLNSSAALHARVLITIYALDDASLTGTVGLCFHSTPVSQSACRLARSRQPAAGHCVILVIYTAQEDRRGRCSLMICWRSDYTFCTLLTVIYFDASRHSPIKTLKSHIQPLSDCLAIHDGCRSFISSTKAYTFLRS